MTCYNTKENYVKDSRAKRRVESFVNKATVSYEIAEQVLLRNEWQFDSAYKELTGKDWVVVKK